LSRSERPFHLTTVADLFVQVLKLCRPTGVVKLGHIALDGTKANASKHKAMSDGRLVALRRSAKTKDLPDRVPTS